MCGIFGIVTAQSSSMTREQWQSCIRSLFVLSESRGKEAAGIALATRSRIVVHKDSVPAAIMLQAPDFVAALNRGSSDFFLSERSSPSNGQCGSSDGARGSETLAAIGHCRLVTNGLQGIDANNQPVWRDNTIVVHNGIVVNVDELWNRENGIQAKTDVDSEVIAALIEKYRANGSGAVNVANAVRCTFADIKGETSVAMLFRDLNVMVLATNTGSLFMVRSQDNKAMFFASEAFICQQLTNGPKGLKAFYHQPWTQIKAGKGILVDLESLTQYGLELQAETAMNELSLPNIAPMLGGQRVVEDKAKRYEDYRRSLKRCTKCLLPSTMPYIHFDDQGVCNYCHNFKPWTRKPISDLEQILGARRSQSGSADCVIAFSGGRDSSYGLHLLKTKYNINPLAYTYDWGMVTDLARRNQARMCGKLGVEHLWVSADIRHKRANIRRNVQAWLRKPDLGLIPLFMAGDKQYFWHANRTMRDTGIPLMVLCANHYEKTDFKAGFLGVASHDATIHKPASLSPTAKLAMAARYGARFLSNPRYINRSLPDTIGAFISYYLIEQNYVSFFDYEDWDEEKINKVLIGEYDWEIAEDTDSTWRIGDGTAPFYNFIYHSVAGFTEADTFRSNQIRQGVLDRGKAMTLVERENQPRWDSIREYLQLINVDFDEAIRIIDRIPKLYVPKSEGGISM